MIFGNTVFASNYAVIIGYRNDCTLLEWLPWLHLHGSTACHQIDEQAVISSNVIVSVQMLLYTKILSLSMWNFSSQAVSVSQIVSHFSVDTNNMLFCSCVIHFVWLLPLKVKEGTIRCSGHVR